MMLMKQRIIIGVLLAFAPDFGEDSPNLSFDSQIAKKRQ